MKTKQNKRNKNKTSTLLFFCRCCFPQLVATKSVPRREFAVLHCGTSLAQIHQLARGLGIKEGDLDLLWGRPRGRSTTKRPSRPTASARAHQPRCNRVLKRTSPTTGEKGRVGEVPEDRAGKVRLFLRRLARSGRVSEEVSRQTVFLAPPSADRSRLGHPSPLQP